MIEYYDPRAGDAAQTPAFWPWLFAEAGWLILCAAGGALFVIGVSFTLGMGLGIWSLLFALLTTVALAIRARILQRSRAMLAVNYLEQAVRLNLPIPPMLAAAEKAERGPMRRRLGRLRAEVEAGAPIAFALQRASPGAPPRVIGLISAGERLGRLPQALRRTASTERRILQSRRPLQSIMLRWYPMLIVVGIVPVFSVMMIYVMPKFEHIYHDYGMQLPGLTLRLIHFWDEMVWPLTIAAAVGMALACARMFADLFPLRRPPRRRIGWFDRLAWTVPPWRGIVRSRALGDACHVISDAFNAGQPIDRAVADAGEIAPNSFFRRQMQEWTRHISEGVPLADAAQRAALPALMIGMLRTARDSAGTSEVFAFLARYYDGRFSRTAALLEGAAIPLMALLMGAFVVTMALGLFLPLVHLMEHLTTNHWVM